MRLVALLVAPACAFGAVAGSSQSPYPGRDGFVDTINDGVITFRNRDDGLTGGARAAGVTDDGVRLCLDYRLVTDLPRLRRCDDMVFAIGSDFHPDYGYDAEVMIGLRVVGNLDGQSLQNDVHAVCGSQPMILPYDTSFAPTPVLIAGIWPHRHFSGPDVTASVDTFGVRFDARLRLEDPTGHARLTAGWRMHMGDAPSPTIRRAENEADGWVVGGALRVGHLGYSIEYGAHKCIASVGITF